MCVEEFGVFLIFVDFRISCFEVTLVGAFMSFVNFLSWVNDGLMWMVHEIFNAMFESKEVKFCWCIHLDTEAHGEIFKIIASLDSGFHEATNHVIEWYSMLFYIFFQFVSNERCTHKEYISKHVSTGNVDCWNFTSSSVFVTQYFWIMFFMMWSVWSILIPYFIWKMLMLRKFSFGLPWKEYSKRVSNYCVSFTKKLYFLLPK